MKIDISNIKKLASTFVLASSLCFQNSSANSTNEISTPSPSPVSLTSTDNLESQIKPYISNIESEKTSNDWFSIGCELNHLKDIEKTVTNLDTLVSSSVELSKYVWDFRLTSCEFYKKLSFFETPLSNGRFEKNYNLMCIKDFYQSIKNAEKTLNHIRINETNHEIALNTLYEMSKELTNFYGSAQRWFGDVNINVPEKELENFVVALENKYKYKQAFILAYTSAQKGEKEKASTYLNQARCYLGSIEDEDFLKKEGWKPQRIKTMVKN